jgi:pimeloyl-ACP methyl ester carboxylesterase
MTPYHVFLPGTLCDERVFKNQVSLFSPGEVVDLRHSSTMEQMLAAVSAVQIPRFHLIGFSMGGHVAQEFALRYPERITKLVLLASSSEGYPIEERKKVLSAMDIIERGKFQGISDRRLREFLHPASFENLEIRSLIHAMAGSDAKEVYLRQLSATLDRKDLRPQTRNLKLPTLFIGGADDKIVTVESVERSAANIPNAKFSALMLCGHFVPLEQPDEANDRIRQFLT